MPQLKSLPGFSPHLCPHPGTTPPNRPQFLKPALSSPASAQATPSSVSPCGDPPPPGGLPCPREDLLSTELPEPWPPFLLGQGPRSSACRSPPLYWKRLQDLGGGGVETQRRFDNEMVGEKRPFLLLQHEDAHPREISLGASRPTPTEGPVGFRASPAGSGGQPPVHEIALGQHGQGCCTGGP